MDTGHAFTDCLSFCCEGFSFIVTFGSVTDNHLSIFDEG